MRRGLVLSGGGALGAYQAGVLRALHEANIEFEAISATSIGSINAAAWNIESVIGELHEHWIEQSIDLKPFDAKRLLKFQNPVQFHATIDKLVERYRALYPFDNERAEVMVTVTDMATRKLETFFTGDQSIPKTDRELYMKASTAILHIGSAPVEIQGRKYYDGGYYNNVPIEPLLGRDFDEIWVVPVTPVQGYPLYKRSRPMDFSKAKKALPFTLGYSLVCFLEQLFNPPSMDRGPSRKVIISPFTNKIIKPGVVLQSILFTPKGITYLTEAGYLDAQKILEDYFKSLQREPTVAKPIVERLELALD